MITLRTVALTMTCACLALCGAGPSDTGAPVTASGYTLGPNDQISIQVLELPEFQAKSYRVDSDGTIQLPFIGRIWAGGRTLQQFTTELETCLRSQVRNPHVTVSLAESKSQPVSVLGAVNSPGTQQIEGSKTLFDVIAGAGGLKQDAGDLITVTRLKDEGPLNLPNAVTDPGTGRTTAVVQVHDLIELRKPGVNIALKPHDEVSVGTARVLYVIGNVKKPGGFPLSGKRPVSALEALSLAEGLSPNAAPGSARILRLTGDNDLARRQIPLNLKRVLAGKDEDVQLFPEDILFIPDNGSRKVAGRVAETALATVSGIVIWRGL